MEEVKYDDQKRMEEQGPHRAPATNKAAAVSLHSGGVRSQSCFIVGVDRMLFGVFVEVGLSPTKSSQVSSRLE